MLRIGEFPFLFVIITLMKNINLVYIVLIHLCKLISIKERSFQEDDDMIIDKTRRDDIERIMKR